MNFEGIPDTLDTKELAGYFKKFFEIYEGKPKNITALKEAEELFTNQESSDLDSSWVEAEDKLIGQISKWQASLQGPY